MRIELEPVGYVEGVRKQPEDDYWGGEISCIKLTDEYGAEALQGIEDFSHVEVVFYFDRIDPNSIVTGLRHPRNNAEWPAVGIFAQRGRNRPNRLGCTICRIVRGEGNRLFVAELDALDGTPVVDIKPVMSEFLPREEVRQPEWSHELMLRYWARKEEESNRSQTDALKG